MVCAETLSSTTTPSAGNSVVFTNNTINIYSDLHNRMQQNTNNKEAVLLSYIYKMEKNIIKKLFFSP
jgi:hypothetical protein